MELILILIGALIFLPVLAYMVMKFGTAGYLRAKRREQNETTDKNYEQK